MVLESHTLCEYVGTTERPNRTLETYRSYEYMRYLVSCGAGTTRPRATRGRALCAARDEARARDGRARRRAPRHTGPARAQIRALGRRARHRRVTVANGLFLASASTHAPRPLGTSSFVPETRARAHIPRAVQAPRDARAVLGTRLAARHLRARPPRRAAASKGAAPLTFPETRILVSFTFRRIRLLNTLTRVPGRQYGRSLLVREQKYSLV